MPDCFERTNINRQIDASEQTLGRKKVDVAAERIRGIDPDIEVVTYDEGVTAENIGDFLDGCDFVHEAIDYSAPAAKILLHREARKRGIIATTSAVVGTGSVLFVFLSRRDDAGQEVLPVPR